MEKEVVKQTVECINNKGVDISNEEVEEVREYCLRKMQVVGKSEEYFEILFPDVLREYLFRRTLNAISLLNMMEVENV